MTADISGFVQSIKIDTSNIQILDCSHSWLYTVNKDKCKARNVSSHVFVCYMYLSLLTVQSQECEQSCICVLGVIYLY
jgi:hypothetical protein